MTLIYVRWWCKPVCEWKLLNFETCSIDITGFPFVTVICTSFYSSFSFSSYFLNKVFNFSQHFLKLLKFSVFFFMFFFLKMSHIILFDEKTCKLCKNLTTLKFLLQTSTHALQEADLEVFIISSSAIMSRGDHPQKYLLAKYRERESRRNETWRR